VRGHTQFGTQWRLQASETTIGRNSGVVLFPEDTALADRHARLVFEGPDLFVEPLPSTNGVFIRLREPARLQPGDEFIVGAQRLRLLPDHERPIAVPGIVDGAGTRLLGSVVRSGNTVFVLARITADPAHAEIHVRHQRLLTVGRTTCDVNFTTDSFVSERHAQLTHEGSHVVLEDLKSRNGTFVRITGPWRLVHGDLLLVGDQVVRVEFPASRG
jgi:pSer/pThr/pTyr-binding forkhead associated (FHA) protein